MGFWSMLTRVSLEMPSIDQALAPKFFTNAPSPTGSASVAISSTTLPGRRVVTVALPAAFIRTAVDTSTSSPPSVPALVPVWFWRHNDKVAGGRSFARQNSLTLWPLLSCRASHSALSAAVQLTLVRRFVAAVEAVGFVTAFVIVQVLLVENLHAIYQSIGAATTRACCYAFVSTARK